MTLQRQIQKNSQNLYFADWLRAFGCIAILICHLVGFSGIPYGTVAAQFFNIGVEIFLLLSGFLFGIRGEQTQSLVKWYGKRLKRIFIPLWLFLIILFILSIVTKTEIKAVQWLKNLFGIQGFDGVKGAEHTWYITLSLICYLFTPAIAFFAVFWESQSHRIKEIFVVTLLILPAVCAFVVSGFIWNFFVPLSWYTLAFLVGHSWKRIVITSKVVRIAILLMISLFAIRLAGRYLADETLLYDRLIVGYEHFIAAGCIGLLFSCFFGNRKPNRAIQFISENSYEIYLYHVMFISGPVSLLGLTSFVGTDFLIIVAVTMLLSATMHHCCQLMTQKLTNGDGQ